MRKLPTFKDASLRVKANLIFLLVVVFPILILGSVIIVEMNNVMRKQALDYTEGHLNTVENSLHTVVQDIEDISTYMIFSDEFRDYLSSPTVVNGTLAHTELEEDLVGFFVFHLMAKNYLNSITVDGVNGNELYLGEPIEADETYWEEQAEQAAGDIRWSLAYPVHSYWTGEENVVSMFRVINDINNINRKIGSVTIRLKVDELTKMLNAGLPVDNGTTFILDQAGKVVLHEDKMLLGKAYPDQGLLKKIMNGSDTNSFSYSVKNEDLLVASKFSESGGWTVVTTINEEDIVNELRGIRYGIYIFLVVTTALGLIAIIGFYITIINPIVDLTRKTKQVEEGDFSVFVDVNSKDEIGRLKHRFNQMVGQIQHLINTKYRLEIKQRESELTALQNQINPHFLYNTLDMIRWTARMEKAMETSRLIELLSKMFRISLSRGQLWISLKEELTYVESYLELQKKRLGTKLSYQITCDESIQDVVVLKQILQPLVENSIVHGFKGKLDMGMIQITVHEADEEIIIDIVDNGSGVDVKKMNEYVREPIDDSTSFALSNVNDRIIMAFGDEYSMTFMEHEQPGTWVRVKLPAFRDKPNLKSVEKE
ncbi:cache domain-containing sensor histidine kinase [Ferdinandcohnia sp. Marseille-Q9671]